MPDKVERFEMSRGSGDIFADLGITLTAEDRTKIEIAHEITRVIAARGYTQSRAAQLLETDQAKVSKICRGNLSDFSIQRLMWLLLRLGVDVDIRTSDSRDAVGRLTVNGPLVAVG